ncbi:unnamed protein product [Rotaria socialis]
MSAIPKSNIKRIRDILLADENRINNDVNDNQGSDSDSESDFLATESDDTSNSEHISKESDLSNSDFEHGDVVTVSQPETLKKNGVTWSMYPNFSSHLYSLCISRNLSAMKTKRSTILHYWNNGHRSPATIARITKIAIRTVKYNIIKIKNQSTIEDRPRKITANDDKALGQWIRRNNIARTDTKTTS